MIGKMNYIGKVGQTLQPAQKLLTQKVEKVTITMVVQLMSLFLMTGKNNGIHPLLKTWQILESSQVLFGAQVGAIILILRCL